MKIDGNKVWRFSKHTKTYEYFFNVFFLKHELLVEIKNWLMLRVHILSYGCTREIRTKEKRKSFSIIQHTHSWKHRYTQS